MCAFLPLLGPNGNDCFGSILLKNPDLEQRRQGLTAVVSGAKFRPLRLKPRRSAPQIDQIRRHQREHERRARFEEFARNNSSIFAGSMPREEAGWGRF
jgi:hypothetical protein